MVEGPRRRQAGGMNAAPPPEYGAPGPADLGGPGSPGDPGDPGDTGSPGPRTGSGPRVSTEEMRDLAGIRRSTTDRKIAGVAGGLARHFDIDPLVVRVVLVVMIFFGGGGLLIYAAGWLMLPEDDGTPAPIRLDDRSRNVALAVTGALAALALVGDSFGGWHFPWPLAVVGVVVVALLSRRKDGPRPPRGWVDPEHPGAPYGGFPGGASPAPDAGPAAPATPGDSADADPSGHGTGSTLPGPRRPGPEHHFVDPRRRGPLLIGYALLLAGLLVGSLATAHLAGATIPLSAYPAAVLGACGLMLVVGAFWGRGGGLTFIGLLAAAATAVAMIGDPTAAGQVRESPTSADQVDERYALTMGEIQLDLTEVTDLEGLDERTVEVDLRMGHVVVTVPEKGLDVEVVAEIDGGGETRLFGDSRDGSDEASHDGGVGVPTLRIEADMLFGQIEVETQESAA